ncbi:DUF1931 domain-containing protein [Nanoarchaeota archaeon]
MMPLVVKAQVKLLTQGFNVSSDFTEELDNKVKGLISTSLERAKANGRKTVMARDL